MGPLGGIALPPVFSASTQLARTGFEPVSDLVSGGAASGGQMARVGRPSSSAMGLGSRKGVGKNNEKTPPCQGSWGRRERPIGLGPAVDLLADGDAGGDFDPVGAAGVHREGPAAGKGRGVCVRGQGRISRNGDPSGDETSGAGVAGRLDARRRPDRSLGADAMHARGDGRRTRSVGPLSRARASGLLEGDGPGDIHRSRRYPKFRDLSRLCVSGSSHGVPSGAGVRLRGGRRTRSPGSRAGGRVRSSEGRPGARSTPRGRGAPAGVREGPPGSRR